jgi:hypothetical protein
MPMDFSFIEDADLRATAETNYATDVTAQTAATQVLIDESISGLKEKNTQLLDEKKTIQKTLKNFDGLDPEAAKEALKFLEGNEDAQLIKDGKIEELLDRKTSTMRTEHETAVEGLSESLLTATESGKKYKGLYESKLLDDSLTTAAIAAKVESTAIADIILNGKGIFSISEDGSVEARDKDGKVLKTSDGKVLTTTNWVEEKRASSPHWWGKSESGDLTPGGDPDDYAAALARAAASGDTKKFRALRKKANA